MQRAQIELMTKNLTLTTAAGVPTHDAGLAQGLGVDMQTVAAAVTAA
jgi:hypothetical protein